MIDVDFTQIWNPPGFFYAIGYTLATASMLYREKSVGGSRRKWLSGLAVWAFLSVLMELTANASGLLFAASMLIVFAALALCFQYNLQNRTRALFLAVKTFMGAEFAASLCWQVYYLSALYHEELRTLVWLNVFMFGGFLAILSLLGAVESALRRGGVVFNYTRRDVTAAALIALGMFVISNLGYISRRTLFSGTQPRDIFAMHTLADMNGVSMIYLLQYQLREVQTRLEKNSLRNIMQLQYQSYQTSQESIELVQRKYHDLKHQIALLRKEGLSAKGEEQLNKMEREIRQFEAQYRSGNAVLDAVLTSKGLACQSRGIELKCIADGSALTMLDEMEIAALFGNMLDNAIESVEQIEEPAQRLIRLYVAGESGFLRIRMENTCAETLRFEDGLPLTTKEDTRYHGFGMKSMRRTVEKHGGSLVAEQDGGWFSLKILIPFRAE